MTEQWEPNIVHLSDIEPEEESRESAYRRGYRDGWIQAVMAYREMLDARRGSAATHDALWEFWEQDLLDWDRGDDSRRVQPPTFDPPKRKKGGR